MKRHVKNLMKLFAMAFFSITLLNNAIAQCETWEAYPKGVSEARKQHVIYKDRFKMKNYDEAYPIWEELFQYVKVPEPAKTTHFIDGATMSFHFASKETDAAKKKEWVEKGIDLYEQNFKCNGEDALMRAYQAYYMYANQYDVVKTFRVYEKSLKLGKDKAPAMIFQSMGYLGVYLYQQKVEGFDAEFMRNLYKKLEKIARKNIKDGNDAAGYKKAWEDFKVQFGPIDEVFGCDYWVEQLEPVFKELKSAEKNQATADSLYKVATKLVAKCGKDHKLYKGVWDYYLKVKKEIEWVLYDTILKSDTTTYYMKILIYRKKAELDTANAKEYKAKEEALYKPLFESPNEWISDKDKADMAYRYADKLFREGAFGSARTYCRMASKLRPDWGQPYILVGIMYASSGKRCSPATNGTGFEAQVCVWPALDEWARAKSVDPSCAAKANKYIGQYTAFMPTKKDLFQRNIAEGSKYTVGCWIQQSTTVRGVN